VIKRDINSLTTSAYQIMTDIKRLDTIIQIGTGLKLQNTLIRNLETYILGKT